MKNKRINTTILVTAISLSSIILSGAQTSEKETTGAQKIREMTKNLLEQKDVFKEAERKVGFWQSTDDNEMFYNIYRVSLENILGEKFTDDQETLKNEDPWNLDAGVSANWSYTIDDKNERFLLRHKQMIFEDTLANQKRSKDEIYQLAASMLKDFGNSEMNNFDIDVRELRRTVILENGQVEDYAIAYKVFVHRKIGDVLVRGSRIVFSYLLDGRLLKILMKWPHIENGSVSLQKTCTNDEIIERTARSIEKNDMINGKDFTAEVGYNIDEGTLKMGIILTALVPGPNDSFFGKEDFIEI